MLGLGLERVGDTFSLAVRVSFSVNHTSILYCLLEATSALHVIIQTNITRDCRLNCTERTHTKRYYNFHLIIEDTQKWINKFNQSKVNNISHILSHPLNMTTTICKNKLYINL